MAGSADKAVFRLTLGLGLAALVAYGCSLPMPFLVCLMSIPVLCKPGPPKPFIKGVIGALIFGALVAAGVLMVPLLEHYALSAVLLTAAVLHGLFYIGLLRANPLTMVLVITFTVIPVVGVMDQGMAGMISLSLAVGLATGTLTNAVSHAFFPDPKAANVARPAATLPDRDTAGWIALRATLVVMPVFILALTNPAFYMAAIMKTVGLGQQAGETDARSGGRELIGSTLMGAWIAALVWFGLSLWPCLWMLVLWLMAAALWAGSGIFRTRRTAFRPSFWSNALATSLLLLGPAIEDSAAGKGVFEASLVRVTLFIIVALYVWGTIWILERWRAVRAGPQLRLLTERKLQ
jgi:hypothetical protein